MFERHYIVLEKKSELSIIFYNLEFFFSHNWTNKLFPEENKVTRTLFK